MLFAAKCRFSIATVSNPNKRNHQMLPSVSNYEPSAKKKKLTSSIWIKPKNNCCSHSCLDNFSPAEIKSLRIEYQSKNEKERYHWLQILLAHSKHTKGKWIFIVNEREVCRLALYHIYSITEYKFYKSYNFLKSNTMFIHGNEGLKKTNSVKQLLIAWVTNFVLSIGERVPNEVGKFHLPHFLNKATLFKDAIQSIKQNHPTLNCQYTLQGFYQVRNQS